MHVHEDGFAHTHGAGAPKEWTVTYTADGLFVPERIEIITGDTVTWVNESSHGVWPASNIHPSHEIYPEFDPLGDIAPGESWSFTFTKNGTWRYHNHSFASETGVITSSGAPEEALAPLDLDVEVPQFPDPPAGLDPTPLLSDLDSLELFVETYGPDAAVAALRAASTQTGIGCHDMAHQAGRVAYQLFGVAAFLITPHECDSGAIHGVLEALFAERGTATLEPDMQAVCTSMGNQYRVAKCVHGVGHGIMAWTGYELHEALNMCDVLGDGDRRSCYSGVFMENGVAGITGLANHQSEYISIVDPHYPCNEVAQRYVADCYGWQPSNLMMHIGLTTQELFGFCDGLLGQVRRGCMRSWAAFVSNEWWPDTAGMVAVCESDGLTDSDRSQCVSGISLSRFSEIDDAVLMARFCGAADESETLSGDIADSCWAGLLSLAPEVLEERSDRDGFCGSIRDDARRDECTQTLLGS